MSRTYLGIDPGLTGAIARLRDGEVECFDMPLMKVGKRKVCDEMRTVLLLNELINDDTVVILEKVGGRPGQSASAGFTFGRGVGVVVGTLLFKAATHHEVRPQEWKRSVMSGSSKEKGASRQIATRIFPKQSDQFVRVKDHGRADAALIAEYGRRNNL